MPRYAVTFRIHQDSDYSERYESFTDQVKKGATYWWAGTTSFYAIQSTESLTDFCSRIYVHSKFNAMKDIFVVVNIETGAGKSKGKITDRDLFRAFPGVMET
jgi:hypothetical protein